MVAERAMGLGGAVHGGVLTFDGVLIRLVAHVHATAEFADARQRIYPMPPGPRTTAARAIQTRAIVHVPDIAKDPGVRPGRKAGGFRSALAVPTLRAGQPLGAVVVLGREPRPFPERPVQLLQTFADQAVIAIENARRFGEAHARHRHLTESLEPSSPRGSMCGCSSQPPQRRSP
jgi:GAF domain-containing protein